MDVTDLRLVWTWQHQEEVDALNEQNALTARLRNGATTLRETFGADWRERVAQIAAEADEMRRHGLIHPATQTVSGQTAAATDPTPPAPPADPDPNTPPLERS